MSIEVITQAEELERTAKEMAQEVQEKGDNMVEEDEVDGNVVLVKLCRFSLIIWRTFPLLITQKIIIFWTLWCLSLQKLYHLLFKMCTVKKFLAKNIRKAKSPLFHHLAA